MIISNIKNSGEDLFVGLFNIIVMDCHLNLGSQPISRALKMESSETYHPQDKLSKYKTAEWSVQCD